MFYTVDGFDGWYNFLSQLVSAPRFANVLRRSVYLHCGETKTLVGYITCGAFFPL